MVTSKRIENCLITMHADIVHASGTNLAVREMFTRHTIGGKEERKAFSYLMSEAQYLSNVETRLIALLNEVRELGTTAVPEASRN